MARKTKTLANNDINALEGLLDDINPAASVLQALDAFYRFKPTFTDAQLTTIEKALVQNYPWKDIKSLSEDIDVTAWN